jgi:hypothetical protein
MTAADRALSRRMFSEAIRCYTQALSFRICDAPRIFWGICRAKCYATNDNEMVESNVKLNSLPEFNEYLKYADPASRTKAQNLARRQNDFMRMRSDRRKERVKLIFEIVGIALGVILFLSLVSCMFSSCEVCADCGEICGDSCEGCTVTCGEICGEFAPVCSDCGCDVCLDLASGCSSCGADIAYVCTDCGGCSICGSAENCAGIGAACESCANELDPNYQGGSSDGDDY